MFEHVSADLVKKALREHARLARECGQRVREFRVIEEAPAAPPAAPSPSVSQAPNPTPPTAAPLPVQPLPLPVQPPGGTPAAEGKIPAG